MIRRPLSSVVMVVLLALFLHACQDEVLVEPGQAPVSPENAQSAAKGSFSLTQGKDIKDIAADPRWQALRKALDKIWKQSRNGLNGLTPARIRSLRDAAEQQSESFDYQAALVSLTGATSDAALNAKMDKISALVKELNAAYPFFRAMHAQSMEEA